MLRPFITNLRIRFFFFSLILLSLLAKSQTPHIRELKLTTQHRIDTYLDKNKSLGGFYSVSDEGMSVYASPEMKKAGKADVFVPWQKLGLYYELLEQADPRQAIKALANPAYKAEPAFSRKAGSMDTSGSKPLRNIVIALDPGHTAGSLGSGKTEQKFLDIPADSVHHTPQVSLVEGHLTCSTALLLKQKLEAAGATVYMTHSTPDGTAFGKTFEQWRKEDLNRVLDSLVLSKHFSQQQKIYYKTKADKRKVFFDVFRDLELQRRADLINGWKPDITVIIHFNVDEKNEGWKKLSDKDFVMTFIGGAMLPHDLSRSDERFKFLRMALATDLDESERLSSCVVKRFSEVLKVPIAGKNDAKYLKENCLSTHSEGVYCRNLILTRIVRGPLVYGETLYQDNRNEALALRNEDGEINGMKTSQRTRDIAEAYFQGILLYFKK